MKIRIEVNSVLKTSTAQSSTLDSDDRYPVMADSSYKIKSINDADDGHLLVCLDSPLGDRADWYVFSPHISLIDDDGDPLLMSSNAESTPQLAASEPPDEAPVVVVKRPRSMVHILGIGSVDLYSSIIPGGDFYWYEATHGGSRLPVSSDQSRSIIRLANNLQQARIQLKQPFRITSWFRPEPFNRKAGGARRSTHLSGGASDQQVSGMPAVEVAKALLGWWPGGIGIYKRMPHIIHLDVGPKRKWGF